MLTYRVSNVEAFRQWEVTEDADTAQLIERICGLGGPSPAMLAGTAFHKCLETAVAGIDYDSLTAQGHRFTFPGEFAVELPRVRELRASRVYMVDGAPIRISGQVDCIEGRRVDDHKTTSRFDPDRYLTGYAWRLYLDIFAAREFRWNVFEMVEVESKTEGEGFELPPIEYEITAQHRLTQYAYPALEADCLALVTRFARFVRDRIESPGAA